MRLSAAKARGGDSIGLHRSVTLKTGLSTDQSTRPSDCVSVCSDVCLPPPFPSQAQSQGNRSGAEAAALTDAASSYTSWSALSQSLLISRANQIMPCGKGGQVGTLLGEFEHIARLMFW